MVKSSETSGKLWEITEAYIKVFQLTMFDAAYYTRLSYTLYQKVVLHTARQQVSPDIATVGLYEYVKKNDIVTVESA